MAAVCTRQRPVPASGQAMHLEAVHLETVGGRRTGGGYYRVSVSPTLFGDWRLDREWGRIGQTGQTRPDTYTSEAEAQEALHRVAAAKAKTGYRVVGRQPQPAGTVVNFIPKRAYAYLNVKICTFFRDDLLFFNMGLRLYDDGLFYMGELVQLSRAQLVFYLWGKRDPLRHVQSTTRQTLTAFTDRLAAYGLSLDAAVPGWTRPPGRFCLFRPIQQRLL